jgi:hypothetical protein
VAGLVVNDVTWFGTADGEHWFVSEGDVLQEPSR